MPPAVRHVDHRFLHAHHRSRSSPDPPPQARRGSRNRSATRARRGRRRGRAGAARARHARRPSPSPSRRFVQLKTLTVVAQPQELELEITITDQKTGSSAPARTWTRSLPHHPPLTGLTWRRLAEICRGSTAPSRPTSAAHRLASRQPQASQRNQQRDTTRPRNCHLYVGVAREDR